jgi:hypothetical protein
MIGRPERDEAAAYYFTYIDGIAGDDIVGVLESQFAETLPVLAGISEERSRHRYAANKWSVQAGDQLACTGDERHLREFAG